MLATGFIFASLFITVSTVNGLLVNIQPSKRESSNITTLSSTQISSIKPYTFFASVAYCNPRTISNWTCGEYCAANPDFIPEATGGNGNSVQFWYVGFSPSQETVIVAHQGTNKSSIEAIDTDLDVVLEPLDTTLFPGFNRSIEAHKGFASEQAKTAADILSAVQTSIAAHGATQVTILGHSLGAAIALLDGVYLPLHISGVSFKVIAYGLPRVGNQAFADYIDDHLSVTHINNKKDPVPTIPGIFMGYHHPSGEVHIMDNNEWVSCLGQDNPSKECTVGDVPNIFDGKFNDHDGLYDGVTMNFC